MSTFRNIVIKIHLRYVRICWWPCWGLTCAVVYSELVRSEEELKVFTQ
jgi:hypothetical protein